MTRPAPDRQTLHLLMRPRHGDADACLASGFSVGTMTAHRHFRGAVDLLAAHTPTSERS
ncbi:transposase family protein [Streptomyces griseus]|uniref:transposase family protein n=1 Tax=Streptomyces griseus TaxID=1911 RepID=UPI0027DF5301|nr:transposase family protein [Streptomyces griseus]